MIIDKSKLEQGFEIKIADVYGEWMEASPCLNGEMRERWYAFARKQSGDYVLLERIEDPDPSNVSRLLLPEAYRLAYSRLSTIPDSLRPAQYICLCDWTLKNTTADNMPMDEQIKYVIDGLDIGQCVGVIPDGKGFVLAYFDQYGSAKKSDMVYSFEAETGEKVKIRFEGEKFVLVDSGSGDPKTVKDICKKYNLTQTALAKRFGIPLRTVQDWHGDRRTPPDYLITMMDEILSKK